MLGMFGWPDRWPVEGLRGIVVFAGLFAALSPGPLSPE